MLFRILAVPPLYAYLEIIILINEALVVLMNANFRYLFIAIVFEYNNIEKNKQMTDFSSQYILVS